MAAVRFAFRTCTAQDATYWSLRCHLLAGIIRQPRTASEANKTALAADGIAGITAATENWSSPRVVNLFQYVPGRSHFTV
jgi:hypothetical protein